MKQQKKAERKKKGMKKFLILVGILVLILAIWLGMRKKETLLDYLPPELAREKWWGVGEKPVKEDERIRKFKIPYNQGMIEDLHTRLKNTKYFDGIVEESKWIRGTFPEFTKDLVKYWQTEFDWKAQVGLLNSYNHFITNVYGLDIHFVHVKAKRGKDTKVLPLLLLHGWPGSFFEFYDAIPYLTDPTFSDSNDFAFDLVIPSLPGYGFSEPTRKKGLNLDGIATIFAKLMSRLGYKSYIAQGGDYGGIFAKVIPVYDPEHCIGVHLNFIMAPIPWYLPFQLTLASILGPGTVFSENNHERWVPLSGYIAETFREMGYLHLQATRPYSLGHALTDSPVGLAAYIIEKFYYWSDNGGDIYSVFTKDQLLTNVMIYWANNTIASSLNYYYEVISDVKSMFLLLGEVEINAPAALADYKKEIKAINTAAFAYRSFKNVIQHNEYEKGGHFAAMELPKDFSKDIISFGELLFNISSSSIPFGEELFNKSS